MNPDRRADYEIGPGHPAFPHTRAEIEAKLLEALDEVERGQAKEMTADEWQEMREEYLEKMKKRMGH